LLFISKLIVDTCRLRGVAGGIFSAVIFSRQNTQLGKLSSKV